jgi:hypothetical protein
MLRPFVELAEAMLLDEFLLRAARGPALASRVAIVNHVAPRP